MRASYSFVIRHSSFGFLIMAIAVPRPKLSWRERFNLPAIAAGMRSRSSISRTRFSAARKVTMQYPEEKWDSILPEHYRGAPALVRDTTVVCVRRFVSLRIHLPAPRDQNHSGGNSHRPTASPRSRNIPRNSISTWSAAFSAACARKFARNGDFFCAKITPLPGFNARGDGPSQRQNCWRSAA